MPVTGIDGLQVNYVVKGEGSPLSMLAPGGFDSSIASWWTRGVWKDLRSLDVLSTNFRMIAYDRRETGASGGRVEQFAWPWILGSVAAVENTRVAA
jgi:pimeloyl-ACP methyl ester carboxylesterase